MKILLLILALTAATAGEIQNVVTNLLSCRYQIQLAASAANARDSLDHLEPAIEWLKKNQAASRFAADQKSDSQDITRWQTGLANLAAQLGKIATLPEADQPKAVREAWGSFEKGQRSCHQTIEGPSLLRQ